MGLGNMPRAPMMPPSVPPRMQTAQLSELELAKIKLNQMLYDRNLSKRNGVDVDGPQYAPVNAQIRMLRDMLKT